MPQTSDTKEILNNLFGDATTKIPDDLIRPDHWDTETLEPSWYADPEFEKWLKQRRASRTS